MEKEEWLRSNSLEGENESYREQFSGSKAES